MEDAPLERTFVLDADAAPVQPVESGWGVLLSVNSAHFPNIKLDVASVWLGRSKDIPDGHRLSTKMISNKHAHIFLENNAAFIEDHSTNGTHLNKTLLQKGARVLLKDGDEIALVNPKLAEDRECPIYVFHDLRQREQGADSDTDADEATLPVVAPAVAVADAAETASAVSGSKRPADDGDDDALSSSASAPPAKQMKKSDEEAMLENLTCGICYEILYKAVALVPCLHAFCGCCYSDWMGRSSECPSCRVRVERVAVNHILNNLVDAFLKAHPDRDRDADEKADMDKRSKITADMVDVRRRRYDPDADDDDDGDGSGSDDDSDDDGGRPQCDQCGAGNPTGFTCGADQRHVNCSACYRPFAVRTDDPAVKQQCEICQRYFCQFYGGNCRSANAPQRFRKLKEHEFAQLPIIWPGCFRGNTYERTVLQDYLTSKNIAATDCYRTCIEKYLAGEYTIAPGCNWRFLNALDRTALRDDANACSDCATQLFGELVFDYRKNIRKEDLPAAVTARADCWYGRNCRTQFNPANPHHRERLNHICEQTRR